MKLIRLKLNTDFRSLQAGFEINFLSEFDNENSWNFMPYCLVGRNGSGKSNILEVLAAIFYHIECLYLDYKPEGFEGEKDDNEEIIRNGFFADKCSPDAFELEYIYHHQGSFSGAFSSAFDISYDAHILISKKVHESPEVFWLNREEIKRGREQKLTRTEVKKFLPDFVIGYSSGENEILSLPFFKMRFIHYDEYEDALRNETGYAQPEGRLTYLDNQYSQAVFLTNYLMQDEEVLRPIHEAIGIKAIRQFRVIINQNKKVAKYRFEDSNLVEEQSLGDQWNDYFELTELLKRKDESSKDYKVIDKLRSCATSQFYNEESKTLYLDYYIEPDKRDAKGKILKDEFGELVGLSEMKKAFRTHFNEDPFELFRAFQTLLTLNLYDVTKETKGELYISNSLYVNETIPVLSSEKRIMRFKDFTIEKKGTKNDILSKSLSDGEHQYLHTLGICLLFRNTNSLFLLDEPETHFNPDWRAKFISTLRDCLVQPNKKNTRELLITSHSPFIVSDCQKENVLVFKRDPKTNNVTVDRPNFNTFGASVNLITIELFNRIDTIGDLASEKVNEFEKRILQEENLEDLKDEIFTTLGDSIERTILINQLIDKRENA